MPSLRPQPSSYRVLPPTPVTAEIIAAIQEAGLIDYVHKSSLRLKPLRVVGEKMFSAK